MTAPTVVVHELVVDVLGRPLTANQVRRIRNRHQLAALVRAWHDAGTVLARANRIPRLGGVHVWAWGRYPDRRSLPDADAVAPAVKAVVDGIVAAGVLPDDKPPHVQAVTYCAPVVAPGLPPALVVRLVPVPDWVHPAEGDA